VRGDWENRELRILSSAFDGVDLQETRQNDEGAYCRFQPASGQFRPFWLFYSGTLSADSFDAERPSPIFTGFKPAVSVLSDAQFLDGGRAGKSPADCE
jgi:hypothetical protein